MTKQQFAALTAETTILDGATGTNLMAAGMPKGVCTEQWVLEHPQTILTLQKAYVDAGSQIIYAPTFGANRINLARHHLADQAEQMNHTLVSYALEAAQGRALVAGDITATGEMMDPFGDLTYEDAVAVYREQILQLVHAGVDLIVAETMYQIQEARTAVEAAISVCDLPILCTMTCDAGGSFFTGGTIAEAAVILEAAGASAVGLNCSTGPEQMIPLIREVRQRVAVPVIAKPNAGLPVVTDSGESAYQMTPETFARLMKQLGDSGAGLLGGCCGTTPAFIEALTKQLQ